MARYIAKIPEWFSVLKAAQVAAFFVREAGGKLNVLKLTKLIYLSDRWSMDARERPITGDNFVSMPFGPVNTYTYSFINGDVSRGLAQWREYIAPRQENDVNIYLAKQISDDEFTKLSRADKSVMSAVWAEFKDVDRFDLAEWTHKYCPEWQNPHGSSVPIDFSTVYKRLSKFDPIELAENIQADRILHVEFTKENSEGIASDGPADPQRKRLPEELQW